MGMSVTATEHPQRAGVEKKTPTQKKLQGFLVAGQ
jgi:hypothetical protein